MRLLSLAFVLVAALGGTGLLAGQASVPLNVYVSTPMALPGALIPIDQPMRVESVKHVTESLRDKLEKKLAVVTMDGLRADVSVEVVGRKADGDDIVLQLRVLTADGKSFDVSGVNDDGHWNDAGNDGAKKIAEWVKLNERNLETLRRRR